MMNFTGIIVFSTIFAMMCFMHLFIWILPVLLFAIYVIGSGYEFLVVAVKTFRRDFIGLTRAFKINKIAKERQKKNMTIPRIFQQNVEKHPDKVCFVYESKEWTFRDVDEMSNRVAHLFQQSGLVAGDTVALLLENRPEYVAIWVGLAKIGLVTALLNYNLRDKQLLHSIKTADTKAVIFGSNFKDAIMGVRSHLDFSMKYYAFDFGGIGIPDRTVNMDVKLKEVSSEQLKVPQRSNYNDKLLYVYTSGTTGLPKAAVIKHYRFSSMVTGMFTIADFKADDSIYVCVPLYHSGGGITGVGMSLICGCTTVIRKQFSATHFWMDCARYRCTVAFYIGEICRYLLAAPERPEDRSHQLRMMYGIGLRPQIWESFTQRFNIPKAVEFYGSTEGNASLCNFEGHPGAIGFISVIASFLQPTTLIRVDEGTGEPIRSADGLCIRCQPGEPGMFVGKIITNHPIRSFSGYSDESATNKKIARNVFTHGDSAFLSGDILIMDELGYVYFKDRTGDTFRWRGENVSTTEVEAIISTVIGLKDCCVYGVEVPGTEGRAGMAAIVDPERKLDLAVLSQEVTDALPSYARPLFIRLVPSMDLTGTFKLRKVDYQREGLDVAGKIKDPVYFMDPSTKSYVPLTKSLHQQLISGQLRI